MKKSERAQAISEWEKTFASQPVANKAVQLIYDQVLTSGARLQAFSTCRLKDDDGAFATRQNYLALDDLVLFAISVRRLIEVTCGKAVFRSLTFPRLGKSDKTPLKMLTIVSALIHNTGLEIIRSNFMAHFWRANPKSKDDWVNAIVHASGQRHGQFDVIVILRSDQLAATAFELSQLPNCIESAVLPVVVKHCEKHKELHLDTEQWGLD